MGEENINVPIGYATVKCDVITYVGFLHDYAFQKSIVEMGDKTALPHECLWTIQNIGRQCRNVPGDFIECGVHKGGSAKFIANMMEGSGKILHLFDTFEGMPKSDPEKDWHKQGDFNDTSVDEVKKLVGHDKYVRYHKGVIPKTFHGVRGPIAFAHVDCDIYQSTIDCLKFIYPRLSKGGVMVLDDYARPTTQGVREAVDEFFIGKPEVPIPIIISAQAIVFKL